MDENLSRGYVQLGKARGMNEFKFSNGFTHLSPPVDKCNFIYFALILGGVGFLLPYNRSRSNQFAALSHLAPIDLAIKFQISYDSYAIILKADKRKNSPTRARSRCKYLRTYIYVNPRTLYASQFFL